jgi:competence protein ComEC
MSIIYWGICWFAGLWLASVSGLSLPIWLVIGAVGGAGAVLFGRQAHARVTLLCLCALGWGAARYTTAVPQINSTHIAAYNDTANVTLTGLVVDEPDVRDRSVNLRLAADTITFPDGSSQAVDGLVLVRAFRFPVIAYGTRVEVTGNLETPRNMEDFNYQEYLARQGIHSLVHLPSLTILAESQGGSLYQAIFAFKGRAQATINRLFPEPQASLLTGILLGNDTGIPQGLDDAFRITGMSHIIAISG